MTDILFRYSTHQDFVNAMFGLGIPCYYTGREEEFMAHCSTPPIVTHQGIVRRVRFTDEAQLALLPDVLTPTFLIDEDSRESSEGYIPTYTADLTDINGNLYVGTVYPGVFA